MEKNKYILDKYGFNIRNHKFSKTQILFEEKIFFLGKFKRRFDLCLTLPKFNLIKNYYQDKYIENLYLSYVSKIKFFKIYYKIFSIFFFFLFPKKKIYVNKDEIVLFGPYSQSYSHFIHEFAVRLIYLQKYKKIKDIYVPSNLKLILSSKIYRNVFNKLNFKYYANDKNYIFTNCRYLTHTHNRWIFKNKKKKIPKEFKNLIKIFTKKVNENVHKNKNYKYLIISRLNAKRRNLTNEDELFARLKKYGFKRIFFEKMSYKKQIEVSQNCKIMLGYHGAGLTNSFFMKSGTHLIEIYNKFYAHEHPEFFARSVNVNFKKFMCLKNKKNLDGECDINEIEKFIKKII
mgnify:CR=1 FL=1